MHSELFGAASLQTPGVSVRGLFGISDSSHTLGDPNDVPREFIAGRPPSLPDDLASAVDQHTVVENPDEEAAIEQ